MKGQGSLVSVSPVTQSAVSILPPPELWDAIQVSLSVPNSPSRRLEFSMIRVTPDGIPISICCGLSFLQVCFHWLLSLMRQGYFPQALELVNNNAQFKKMSSFRVRLETFSFTPGSKYLHLEVQVVGVAPPQTKGGKKKAPPLETPLDLLYKTLAGIFPSCSGGANPTPAPGKGKPTQGKKDTAPNTFSPHMTVAQLPQDELPEKCAEFQSNWQPIEFDVTEIYFLSRKTDSEKMKVLGTIKLG